MHRLLRSFAALLLVGAAVPALATNGMRMTGFGPVQNSMGGVGTALTLDSSTIVSNPAGLSDLDRRLDISATWFVPTVEYSVTAPPQVAVSGATQTSNKGGSLIPTIGLVLPLGAGFTTGIGVFGVAGMGVDYDANLFGSPLTTSYQQLRVAPALSWKMGAFSAGLAVNVAWAQMAFDAASAVGNYDHPSTSAMGYGATLGVKFNVMKTLAVGLSYETKTSFQNFEWTIPAHTVFYNGPPGVQVPGGVDQLKFDQPPVLAGGISWQAATPLFLALDVEWIQWSATNGKDQPAWQNNTQLTGSMPFNMNWSDQVVVKIGAEYAVSTAWKIRAGYNYGKNPLDAAQAFESIAFPAIAESHFQAGLGWAVSDTVAINLAGTYSPKSTQTGSDQANGILGYTTSMSQYAIDLGVGWHF
jgi:long-chain fatty acid transport protein